MIKLKDILAESKNIELGKLTTMKDDPPFMTEEQWMEKWSRDGLDEGVIDDIKNAISKPLKKGMKKAIISFVERTI